MKKAKSHTFLGTCVRYINKYVLSHIGLILIKDRYVNSNSNRVYNSVVFEGNDFIRYNMLELLASEIDRKKVSGAVAEIGVYRGDFACIINKVFPTKKLYLYDTFQGFDKKDIKCSLTKKHNDIIEDFSSTGIDCVLSKMVHKKLCIIRKGYFPHTARPEKNEHFCFVSIDPDLFEPTYNALKFFYPRLSYGGYIMVHDYLSSQYEGSRRAIQQFSREEKVPFLIIPDHMGSAIFMK